MKRTTCLIPIVCAVLTLSAQPDTTVFDYHTVKHLDPWLTSRNAAALTRFSSPNMAQAQATLSHEQGGLADYYQPPRALLSDLRVEAYQRTGKNTVVFGQMSYTHASAHDVSGSVFTNPTRQPFDLVEDSLTNQGKAATDTYHLTGAVGTHLASSIAIGASLDYTSANMAKYKDLRHKNMLMNLQAQASVYIPLGQLASLGASYLYHRNTESLVFSTYGKVDKVYKTLVAYAAFMGYAEQFGTNGYTNKSHEMPLVDDRDGLALQLDLHPWQPLSLYQQFTFFNRRGYYGNKSPYTITYARHHSHIYQYEASLQYHTTSTCHRLDLTLEAENLENKAAVYRELVNETGASYYEYYAPSKTANKLWVEGHAAYTLSLGQWATLPSWQFTAAYDWQHTKQTAYLYPYYRRQKLNQNHFSLTATHNRLLRRGVLTMSVTAGFINGNGQPYTDLTFTAPSDKQTAPDTMDAFLWRQYQWLTSPQRLLSAKCQYAFPLPHTSLMLHAGASASHRKANRTCPFSDGSDRTTLAIFLGCTF